MSSAAASYRKTVTAFGVAALFALAGALIGHSLAYRVLPTPVASVGLAIVWALAALLLFVTLAGVVVLVRHARRERGDEDLFLALNKPRSEQLLRNRTNPTARIPFAALRRLLGTPAFVVGDAVRIRSLSEIGATLDSSGCLDGLPFMPEMARYCGTTGTVFRCVDKVYDYGGRKNLRRLRDTVLVAGLRCDGTAHDGCQARCYLLWKTAWLERVAAQAAPVGRPSTDCAGILEPEVSAASIAALPILGAGEEEHRTYVCQYTEIVRASSELSPSDPRQDLRPLIAGNITMTAFGVAMLTRLFNAAQRLRGGLGYPPSRPNLKPASGDPPLELHPGDLVRVANPEKIFVTLDKSGKNRGLWFDRDMLKHCGRTYRVLYRANKLIDDATRRMRRMKSPCIVLEDLDVSGEYLRFCAQHDYPFWREDWLERVESGGRRCGPGLGLRSAGAPAQSAARAPDHRKAYGGIENPSGEQRGRAL